MLTSNFNDNSELSSGGPQLPQVPQPENALSDSELMKHSFVKDLFYQNLELQSSWLKMAEIHMKMSEFFRSLQDNLLSRVSSLETELLAAKQKIGSLTADLQYVHAKAIS
jgi:hypothetical protein